MPLLGAHMSIAGGYYKAVLAAAELKMDCVQIFTKNNNQWRAKPLTDDDVARFQQALDETGIQMPYVIAGIRIKPDQITILIGTALLVTALHLFLQHTRTGKAMRAMADNVDLARITGIDTERVVLWTWVIAAILAAAAGVFYGMDTRLHPVMGFRILLDVFAAAILGGIGRPYGAIAGGMVIGIAEETSTLFLDPPYKAAVAFAILVVMLIFRPTGLFAGR